MCSGNRQLDNTPDFFLQLELQTNRTRFIREYGGEMGGPLIGDRLGSWAAGAAGHFPEPDDLHGRKEIPIPQTATLEP